MSRSEAKTCPQCGRRYYNHGAHAEECRGPDMVTVRLIGGPLDGEQRDVRRDRQAATFKWEDETVEQDWDGVTVYATRLGVATYVRAVDGTFRFATTPLALGDQIEERA